MVLILQGEPVHYPSDLLESLCLSLHLFHHSQMLLRNLAVPFPKPKQFFRMRYFTFIFMSKCPPSYIGWPFLLADFAARQASGRIRGSFDGITANPSKRETEGFRLS
jgi:hypothetical protein